MMTLCLKLLKEKREEQFIDAIPYDEFYHQFLKLQAYLTFLLSH
jgi:hypothetical protein